MPAPTPRTSPTKQMRCSVCRRRPAAAAAPIAGRVPSSNRQKGQTQKEPPPKVPSAEHQEQRDALVVDSTAASVAECQRMIRKLQAENERQAREVRLAYVQSHLCRDAECHDDRSKIILGPGARTPVNANRPLNVTMLRLRRPALTQSDGSL